MTVLQLPAPAKLNLFLHVVGRRADGYHLLQTVFRFIDLQDTLTLRVTQQPDIRRVTPLAGVPEAQCLTVRAAQALQAATGVRQGVEISLEKRIPAGGGLGGGSSDAATVLLGLNQLWQTGLSRQELMALALPLGADVPVFVGGENAFAEGVGEQLTPVALPPRWYVVVQPQASVPTAAIFSDESLTRDSKPIRIVDFSGVQEIAKPATDETAGNASVESLASAQEKRSFGRNDLESVVCRRFPVVAAAGEQLAQAVEQSGLSDEVVVRLTGTGACWFAECKTKKQADALKSKFHAIIRAAVVTQSVAAVWVCQGLSQHPIRHPI